MRLRASVSFYRTSVRTIYECDRERVLLQVFSIRRGNIGIEQYESVPTNKKSAMWNNVLT